MKLHEKKTFTFAVNYPRPEVPPDFIKNVLILVDGMEMEKMV